MAEPWLELVQTIQDVPAPRELRQEILRRRALLRSDATGMPMTQTDPPEQRGWVRRGRAPNTFSGRACSDWRGDSSAGGAGARRALTEPNTSQ